MKGIKNSYNIFHGKTEWKRSLGRRRHRWKLKKIKIDVNKIGIRMWTRCIWFRTESSEHGNETPGSMKVVNF
jgi:hypothetical protein